MTKWKTWIGRIAAAIGLAAALGTPAAAKGPALWKLADADTTIYLFGTIHALPKGLEWRTPAIDAAFASADQLVLETTIDGNPMGMAQALMRVGRSPGLPPLAERVSEQRRPALAAMTRQLGAPPALLDGMETWAAALMLIGGQLGHLGVEPSLGVEQRLAADSSAAKRPVIGLETSEQQLGFFDTLSEDAQRALLESALDDPAKAKAEFQAMLDAWRTGDVDGIARTFDSETTKQPELREVLMQRRNAAWTEWLQKRLEQPGTIMVAVGAGHLAGQDSVQAMLAKRGLTVERLQ